MKKDRNVNNYKVIFVPCVYLEIKIKFKNLFLTPYLGTSKETKHIELQRLTDLTLP